MHVHLVDELYQASWRPGLASAAPPFPNALPAAPSPSPSVALSPAKPPAAKPAGAYRPPGARGLAAPSIFKREDEGGSARMPSNGISPPPRVPGSPAHQGGKAGNRQRNVPGAGPSGPAGGPAGEGGVNNKKGQQQQRRKREGKKEKNDKAENGGNDLTPLSAMVESEAAPAAPADAFADGLDPVAKKIRNLTKKLKAIDELKEKAKRGEKLEVTQLKKIETEGEIKKELATLGNGV